MPSVSDVMTANPICCTPDTPLVAAARMMRDGDFGSLPVVEDLHARQVIGTVTDRDLVVRCIADGADPAQTPVAACMTGVVRTVSPETSVDDCRRLMEGLQVRRVPVIDGSGKLIGVVALADLSHELPGDRLGETVAQISQHDTRQLYSEVMEGGSTRTHVTAVDDPTTEHPIGTDEPERKRAA